MSECIACGTRLENFEYQSRAADEAHTSVTSCPKCPINPNKLDSDTMPRSSHRGMTKPVRRSLPIARRTGSYSSTSYVLNVEIPYGHELYNADLTSRHLVQQVSLHKRSVSDQYNGTPESILYSVSGLFEGQSTKYKDRLDIGMGVYLETYESYNISVPETNRLVVKANFSFFSKIGTYDCHVYSLYGDKTRRLVVQLGTSMPASTVLNQLINSVYTMGFLPNSISQYIHKSDILRLSNLSPRAWDASSPPTSSYTFTSKPDGQRMWLIWCGNIWYVCEPKCRGGAIMWKWISKYQNTTTPVVLDAEYLLTRGFILIDFLTDSNGNMSPISRDIQWVQQQYNNIHEICDTVDIKLRKYFDEYDAALKYSNEEPYPTDGVVAIRNGSTEILKIKPFKSMELSVTEDRYLSTADGDNVMKIPDKHNYDTGAIVEVRFTVKPDGVNIIVHDIFERSDKRIANDNVAVSNIIRSGLMLTTPDDNERRAALLWCNDVRRAITQSAVSRQSNKSIVVDVGTGTGQGIDTIPNIDSTSYVFIEPDENKCKVLSRRIGSRRIYKDPHELIPAIRSLKTRSLPNVIINCTLGAILDVQEVYTALFSETKSVIAAFSAHFVVEDLHDISTTFHIPIYGCIYTYDNINSDGILIDTCGVTMRTISDTEASVRWGGDSEYIEPITMSRDYAGLGNVIPGYDLYDLPDETFTSRANSICRNVTLIVP